MKDLYFTSAVTVKWLSPAGNKGTRFRAYRSGEPRRAVTIGYDHELSAAGNVHRAASAFVEKYYPNAELSESVIDAGSSAVYAVPFVR